MSQTYFDNAAEAYDTSFTHSFAGREQRKIVWKRVGKILDSYPKKLNILEINCGTGEDAIWMAQKGHRVLATDISAKMLAQAQLKAQAYDLPNLTFDLMDINSIHRLENSFDLIFSNFGGLNCLSPDELLLLAGRIPKLLTPEGLFLAVVMPRRCFWERLYYRMKRNSKSRDRRLSKQPVEVLVNQTIVHTWFYTPRELQLIFSPSLTPHYTKPVGIGIPPSYLNPTFEKYGFMRFVAKSVELLLGNFSFLSNRSDHFLISFYKK